MLYGVDVSAYQPHFDFVTARNEGIDFAFIKATEGAGWKSGYYTRQIAQARRVGILVAAYHYVRGSDVAGQLANIRSMVSADTPVILDVEDGAGSLDSIRGLLAALGKAGYKTPLIYIPKWYWSGHMGSPDLSGLPPNWHSRYPDNTVRRKENFTLGAEYWPSFGGISTEIAQFTSSLAVANYPVGRIDGNAYRGTRDQLAALLNGDDDMPDAQEIAAAVWNQPIEVVTGANSDGSLRTHQANAGDVLRFSEAAHNATRDRIAELNAELSELKADIAELKVSGIPVVAEVDYEKVADVVNDDADARDRDGDGSTGRPS